MLTHKVLGPDAHGKYSVGYPTPGTTAYTVVCDGCTAASAQEEADRRNRLQLAGERAIENERRECGLRSARPGTKGRH